MEGNTIKKPYLYSYKELYSAYYYDQLCKLWVEKMCERASGSNKLWLRGKRRKVHIDKLLKVKPPVDYSQLTEKQIQYRERYKKHRDNTLKRMKDNYQRNREKKKQYQRERYQKLKQAA